MNIFNQPKNCLECKNDKTCHTYYASQECIKKWRKNKMKKNIAILTATIVLATGCAAIVSQAEENILEEPIVYEADYDLEEDAETEEITEEAAEEELEDIEDSEEEYVEDTEEVEETEEQESEEEDDFVCEYMCEKDGFTYYFTYDYEVNPVDGICYIKMCEHCNYGATYESTKEEISEKFGYSVAE